MDIFKLVGSVFVDTDDAQKSLSKTEDKTGSLASKLSSTASTAVAVGSAIVQGVGTAVSSVVNLTQETATAADEIDKASTRMGISAESYQEYAYVAERCGVSTSVLEQAAKKLEGTDISFDDAMTSIMSLGTEEERTAAATDLFGEKVAYNLGTILAESGDDVDALKQQAEDLGLVMSGDDVAAATTLNDTFADVQETFEMLSTKIGVAFVPIMQKACDFILSYMPQIQSAMDRIAPIITELFESILPPLMELVDQLFPVAMDLLDQIVPVVSEIIADILPIVVELLQIICPILLDLVSALLPVILDLINALLPILKPILTLLSPLLQLLALLLEPLIQLIDLILPPLISLITKVLGIVTEAVGVALQKVIDFFSNFKENMSNIWNAIVEVFKRPINAIIGFINGLVSGVVDGINGIIGALNSIHIDMPSWVTKLTGMTSLGFNIGYLSAGQIPYLAQGGVLDGGSAVVGEDGPELVSANGKKTTVTPLNDNNNAFVETNKKLDTLIDLMKQLLGDDMNVYIDGSALVGAIAPGMNKELGRLSVKTSRGIC